MSNLSAMAEIELLDRIDALLEVDKTERDLEWLQIALQNAVTLEFSTVPPYLCALWSIKDQNHPAARSIRNVVQEEMLHMALACNMLTAIGGVPKINDPAFVPSYPGNLPGHVEPNLEVSLAGLSVEVLEKFIRIEQPAHDPDAAGTESGYSSIGEFYDEICCHLAVLPFESLNTERQISGPLAHMVITSVETAGKAIEFIKEQGEGSTRSPTVPHTDDLAHYYRFLSVLNGRKVTHLDAVGKPVFDGEAWDPPEVWPMAAVPKGGYTRATAPEQVCDRIDAFDRTFSGVLDLLQATWECGDQASLVRAIESMFSLSAGGRELMSFEKDDGSGNYGPCFRYVGSTNRR